MWNLCCSHNEPIYRCKPSNTCHTHTHLHTEAGGSYTPASTHKHRDQEKCTHTLSHTNHFKRMQGNKQRREHTTPSHLWEFYYSVLLCFSHPSLSHTLFFFLPLFVSSSAPLSPWLCSRSQGAPLTEIIHLSIWGTHTLAHTIPPVILIQRKY